MTTPHGWVEKNSRYSFTQSDVKTNPIVTRSHSCSYMFSRASRVSFRYLLQVLIGSLSERSSIECCKTKTKPTDIQLRAALYRAFIADWRTFWKQEFLSEIQLRSRISERYINPSIKCFFQLTEGNITVSRVIHIILYLEMKPV